MLNHVTHGSTNGPKSINTVWDILGTPPIVISSNTFLWYPPNSTAVNGVYKNPGLTVLPWNFPTSQTWPPFVVHLAAPFQGATGHSPAPWHSRQPHSRLALRHKKKTKKSSQHAVRDGKKKWPVILGVFLATHVFRCFSLDFTLGFPIKAQYYQYFKWKNKRWTMQPTPISTQTMHFLLIYGGAIFGYLWIRSGFSIHIFWINHLNESPIIYVKTTKKIQEVHRNQFSVSIRRHLFLCSKATNALCLRCLPPVPDSASSVAVAPLAASAAPGRAKLC